MLALQIPESELTREGHVLLACETCSRPRSFVCRDLAYQTKAFLNGFPILWCEQCKSWAVPGNARYMVKQLVQHAEKNGSVTVNFRPDAEEVDYSSYPPFKLSPMDYMFYPGLWRPQEDGALTPIFFRRRVLLRYHSDPVYDLHFTSNSYGTIVMPAGHHIPFGINPQDLVIMWLGDIAKLPADEINYFLSENVDSDHDLISDFYRGQIDVEWDYESREITLLKLHQKLAERFRDVFGVRLAKYDPNRITQTLKSFAEPALWTFKEVGHVWQAMNNVLVESLNVDSLKKVILLYAPNEDLSGLKGLKLLNKLIAAAFEDVDEKTIAPLFVLYDLRVVASHKDSDSLQDKLKACYERLELDQSSGDLALLHKTLLTRLCESYTTMSEAAIRTRPLAESTTQGDG
jgi:hypothetical protein